ncbi:hypothetical protein HHK36_006474 [Tetracentron sinense]|uniref:PUM-HD domain-containing protein n=1 Tax=Tetracentron sinense TaxID=13715 RepID=A0A834ZPR4_TETSI|nr:hypothetical protein HHK36_006474 [Tetracentron sinense]
MIDWITTASVLQFFEHGSPEQRKEFANQLSGQIYPLSLQMYGCRVIQKALEVIELDQKTQLVHELDGHVMRCVEDQNGNHVIQKCIECVPTEKIGFIISAFCGQVATLSTHPYGCRVIQRVLEHCTDELHSQCIVDEILDSAITLAQDQHTKGRDLVRRAVTWFATCFLILKSVYKQKTGLINIFGFEDWQRSPFAKRPDRARTFHGIYEVMDWAKETIATNLGGTKKKYKPICDIIDRRWDLQMHRPLHAAGYYLNPRFHYDPMFKEDIEVKQGLYDCIERMIPSSRDRIIIDDQMDLFKGAEGLFARETTRAWGEDVPVRPEATKGRAPAGEASVVWDFGEKTQGRRGAAEVAPELFAGRQEEAVGLVQEGSRSWRGLRSDPFVSQSVKDGSTSMGRYLNRNHKRNWRRRRKRRERKVLEDESGLSRLGNPLSLGHLARGVVTSTIVPNGPGWSVRRAQTFNSGAMGLGQGLMRPDGPGAYIRDGPAQELAGEGSIVCNGKDLVKPRYLRSVIERPTREVKGKEVLRVDTEPKMGRQPVRNFSVGENSERRGEDISCSPKAGGAAAGFQFGLVSPVAGGHHQSGERCTAATSVSSLQARVGGGSTNPLLKVCSSSTTRELEGRFWDAESVGSEMEQYTPLVFSTMIPGSLGKEQTKGGCRHPKEPIELLGEGPRREKCLELASGDLLGDPGTHVGSVALGEQQGSYIQEVLGVPNRLGVQLASREDELYLQGIGCSEEGGEARSAFTAAGESDLPVLPQMDKEADTESNKVLSVTEEVDKVCRGRSKVKQNNGRRGVSAMEQRRLHCSITYERHVLERGKPHERSQIICKLAGQIVQMSQHKFASNVVEKCLEHGDTAERELMIEEIVGQTEGNDNLLIMMKDQFANYVVQKILETCTEKQREILLHRIRIHLPALKKYTYGKHIVARFEQLAGEGA